MFPIMSDRLPCLNAEISRDSNPMIHQNVLAYILPNSFYEGGGTSDVLAILSIGQVYHNIVHTMQQDLLLECFRTLHRKLQVARN